MCIIPDDEPRQIVCTGEDGGDTWQPGFGVWEADDFGMDSEEPVGDGERLFVNRRLYDALQSRADAAEAERDTFRAVLIGAGYRSIETIARKSVEESANLGEAVAQITQNITAERDALQTENTRLRATLRSIGAGPIEGQLMEPWIKKAVAAARAALETKP